MLRIANPAIEKAPNRRVSLIVWHRICLLEGRWKVHCGTEKLVGREAVLSRGVVVGFTLSEVIKTRLDRMAELSGWSLLDISWNITNHIVSAIVQWLRVRGSPRPSHGIARPRPNDQVSPIHVAATSRSRRY